MSLPSFDDVLDAAERLRGEAIETPLLRSDALDAACGGRVWVKAEPLQRTGSFKFRGAYNRLSRLTDVERKAGVVALSSGNHAQGVAEAARLIGCPAVIVMPSDAPAIKTAATRALGAEVVGYDRFSESREAISAALAAERGAVLVPSFDDFHIMAGQGTVGLETARQLDVRGEQADVLICPVSGGGLLAGIALSFEALSPQTRLYAAEPAQFDDYGRSLRAGVRVANAAEARSLCDALLAPGPGEMTFAINKPRLAGGLIANDAEALQAMSFAFRHLKLVVEPGGAIGLAALLAGRLPLEGRTAAVIVSGGNVDPELYARAIGGAG